MTLEHNANKQQVHDSWNNAACGENLYLQNTDRAGYKAQAEARYRLEPYIRDFAGLASAQAQKVLEIGVGLGADHQCFAEAGADLYGIDLTERAVEHTRRRLLTFGLNSNLSVGDAENLDFPDDSFDLVYSWGVLHHSPDTPKAIAEVHRVLKRGGGTRHDIPQMEYDRTDALAALCPAGRQAMAESAQYLCNSSRKPRYQGLFGSRGAAAVCCL